MATKAIEVRGLHKAFRLPVQQVDTLKERVLHPLRPRSFRSFTALHDISFDVERGEFLSIVGRNGSGKTTLLKVLASAYRADRGSVRVAGRLAPFIELGVGFKPELDARENIVLNGVMMGLSRGEAAARIDRVIEFAELQDFSRLKLKNFSSGMAVRLGFSMMVHSNADVMLVDEVLAVGDASFQQKCRDTFGQLHDEGRTIILVTHDMRAVREFSDRAMLLHRGEVVEVGSPDEVGARYLELNYTDPLETDGPSIGTYGVPARIARAWLEHDGGDVTPAFQQGEPIVLNAAVEASVDVPNPQFLFEIATRDGTRVFASPANPIEPSLRAGERRQLRLRLGNTLLPGRYVIHHVLAGGQGDRPRPIHYGDPVEVTVMGAALGVGVLAVDYEFEAEARGADEGSLG